jgi:hypothetical protein
MCPDGTFAGVDVEVLESGDLPDQCAEFFGHEDGFDDFKRRVTVGDFATWLVRHDAALPYPLYGYALKCLRDVAETYRENEPCRGCGGSMNYNDFDPHCEECEGCDPLPIIVWDDALDMPRQRARSAHHSAQVAR